MPFAGMGGSDLPKASGFATIPDPYGQGAVVVIPPIRPDVALIHVQEADEDGNMRIHGSPYEDVLVAIMVAKRTHAPNLVYLNTGGSVDPEPADLPLSTADPALFAGTAAMFDLIDLFDLSARGGLDVVFHSGIQIDRVGRINLSALG